MSSKNWTKEKKQKLYDLYQLHGPKWTEIGKVLGVSKNAVYKCFNRTDWNSFFKFKNKEDVLEEDIQEDRIEEAVQGLLDEERSRSLAKAEKRKQNELLSKLATEDIILEKIVSSIIATPPINTKDIKYPKKNKFLTRPQEAVLCFSDLHVGLAVNPDEVGGLGSYNMDIFKHRMENLVETVAAIAEHHRFTSKLDTLHIFSLGDIVHGSNDAGKWGFLHTEQNICDQIFLAVQEIQKAILRLNQVFPKIKFYGVYGNHGRVAKREKEKRFVNWDYIIYKFLEGGLVNQKNIEFVTPRSPFVVANVLGHKFLLTHGDQIRGWNGLPFYGMVRADMRYRTVLERTKSLNDMWECIEEAGIDKNNTDDLMQFAMEYYKSFDFMVLGHFHSMAELETNSGGKIILNSSFAGGDDYSINTLMSANSAAQKFFGVHQEGKTWTYDIQLDRER